MPKPQEWDNLQYERKLWSLGCRFLAGIDEAGRGPLAGPVVSACVVFESGVFIEGVTDSKKLTHLQREKFYSIITEKAVSWHVGIVDNLVIDEINIYQATKLSMKQALAGVTQKPDHLLIDAMPLETGYPADSIIKGDLKSFTIAAASIIAKVTRDRLMQKMHEEFPMYNWAKNKGYPTLEHRNAIKKHGFTPYHRRTFAVK